MCNFAERHNALWQASWSAIVLTLLKIASSKDMQEGPVAKRRNWRSNIVSCRQGQQDAAWAASLLPGMLRDRLGSFRALTSSQPRLRRRKTPSGYLLVLTHIFSAWCIVTKDQIEILNCVQFISLHFDVGPFSAESTPISAISDVTSTLSSSTFPLSIPMLLSFKTFAQEKIEQFQESQQAKTFSNIHGFASVFAKLFERLWCD